VVSCWCGWGKKGKVVIRLFLGKISIRKSTRKKKLALCSAIAVTSNRDLVKQRAFIR
jgi:hypothetical protein